MRSTKWQIDKGVCESADATMHLPHPDFPALRHWALRAAWAVLPFTVGSAWGDTPSIIDVTAWAGWTAVLVATLVPHPISLTAVRVGAPLVLVVAARTGSAAAVVSGLVVVGIAFAAETAVHFVNGPAYPNERRFPLRPPGPLLFGPLQLAWAVAVGLPVAGVGWLADDRAVLGAAALVAGLPVSAVLLRSLHALSRRWVVFVPAGLVLHDGMALADPVLFQRKVIETVRLASADTDSLDLTKGALGPAVELVLREKVPMVLTTPGRRGGEPGASARLLFSPTRPGAVLAEAAKRRLPP